MSSCTFEIDTDGVKKNILQADFVQAECERVASDLGEKKYTRNGYHMVSFVGTQRVHAIAFPNTEAHPT